MHSSARLSIVCQLAIGFLTICTLAGCGGPTTYPVAGRVQLTGGGDVTGLAGYVVTFETVEGGINGTGEIQTDGTFKLTTYKENDGAAPGQHRVAITPPSPPIDAPAPPLRIAEKYLKLQTSDLLVEVAKGKPEITLELQPAPQ
jgi:hypothetical protein